MMSKQKNEQYTQVGPGTDMGNLLRCYWMPVAGVSEFTEGNDVKPIRLFGENLVMYKDKSGTFGLVDRHCPHRRADMSYGFTEKCGLRCSYHGWSFKEDGSCLEQPWEDIAKPNSPFKKNLKIKSYPVKTLGGMVWAYMGPLPAPELPVYEPFTWTNGFAQVAIAELPCNWLQCQENSIDPIHFEWMHVNWSRQLREPGAEHGPTHEAIDFEEFDHGFVYKRQRSDLPKDHPMWTIGRVCLWPNGFFLGDHFEWRVPIDDEKTLNVSWFFMRVPNEAEPYRQEENDIPTWRSEITDPETGRWITSHVMNQDFIGWAGQGTITDRTKEHLGDSDRGIVMMRKRFGTEMEAIKQGNDPKAVIRDPEEAAFVPLPIAEREFFIEGMPLEEQLEHPFYGPPMNAFMWQAGQPQEVWDAFRDAMGMERIPVATETLNLG
jgi:5,5'-dehydrodivanillate O-demethylase